MHEISFPKLIFLPLRRCTVRSEWCGILEMWNLCWTEVQIPRKPHTFLRPPHPPKSGAKDKKRCNFAPPPPHRLLFTFPSLTLEYLFSKVSHNGSCWQ